jgi:hypothetical protein
LRSDPSIHQGRVDRCPSKRWGYPIDFAGPAVFLASRASQYVCGEVIVVDGVSSIKFPKQIHLLTRNRECCVLKHELRDFSTSIPEILSSIDPNIEFQILETTSIRIVEIPVKIY